MECYLILFLRERYYYGYVGYAKEASKPVAAVSMRPLLVSRAHHGMQYWIGLHESSCH